MKLDTFKTALEAERNRLSTDMENMEQLDSSGPGGDPDAHAGEEATELLFREQDQGLLEGMERQLALVDAALARIENGAYGKCTACGCVIPTGRLEAIPYAPHCIPCAERMD